MFVESDVLINKVLLDRVLRIKQNAFLHNGSFGAIEDELIEDIKLTRLGKMVESLTEDEMAVLVLVAVHRYPEMVFQVLSEEYLSVINKDSKEEKRKQ